MRNSIVCRFCKNPAQHKPLKEAQLVGVEVYFCFNCGAEYSTYGDRENIYYSLYTFINNKLYRWSLGGTTVYLSHIGMPGEPGVRVNEEVKVILAFPEEEINVNPQNVNDKTKTILLFL